MLRHCYQFEWVAFLVATMSLLVGTAITAADPVLNSKIEKAITQVRTAKSSEDAAETLLRQMMGINPKSVDDRTVTDLIALLHDPDYNVRAVVTIALGQLGRKAERPNPILNRELEEAIAEVRAGKSLNARCKASEKLFDLLNGIDPMYVSDGTIADMVSLLNNPDDAVRGNVAGVLGVFGPRAKAAVPKLLALLPAADCLQGDLTSAGAIRLALERMGVKPPPYNPKNCK